MNAWHIYVLKDPRNQAIRYVGVTKCIDKRVRQHVKTARKGESHKDRWIRQLLNEQLKPIAEVVATGGGDWQAAER